MRTNRGHRQFVSVVATLLLSVAPCAAMMHVHESNTAIDFDIPAGDLSESLKAFGEQAGVFIIFDASLVGGKSASALNANTTARDAMRTLLEGSDLEFRRIDARSWAIAPAPSDVHGLDVGPKKDDVLRDVHSILERDEIIVTASYRPPARRAGERAEYSVDGDELQTQGVQNVSEPIFELPASVSSVTSANTALFITTAGLNLADLRGLGAARTLVLVNGRRYVRTSGGNGSVFGVDLNAIPAAFVERLEIINQGAGAAIGDEAVAGAINIVTRTDIDGLELKVGGGLSQQGDAGEYAVSLLGGTNVFQERGRVTLGVTYAREPSLLVPEREDLTNPYDFAVDGRASDGPGAVFTRGAGNSSFTPNGRIVGATLAGGGAARGGAHGVPTFALSADGASFDIYEARLDQLYDWTTDFSILPEIERVIGMADFSIEVADGHRLYGEAHLANVDVGSQIAAQPITPFAGNDRTYGDSIVIPSDNAFIPDGLVAELETQFGEPIDGVLLSRRFVELGPRRRDIERRTTQFVGGIEGDLGGDWRYDLFYQYGRSRTNDVASGIADGERVDLALDPARCATMPGCSPINIFGSENITPEQADFIAAEPLTRRLTNTEQVAEFRISGPLYALREEQGFLTAGLGWRREALDDDPIGYGPESRALGEFGLPGSSGAAETTEAFIIANAPLFADVRGAHIFEIGGAARLVTRNDGPEFFNFSANIHWAPVKGIDLYTHLFDGGRMPNIVEMYSAGPDSRRIFFDPCDFPEEDFAIAANCASDGLLGVGAGFEQTDALTDFTFTGNPDLSEERVNSQIYGAALNLHELLDTEKHVVTLSADWRRYEVRDLINGLPSGQILITCYLSDNFANEFCGENPATGRLFIERDPISGQVSSVQNTFLNRGMAQSSSLDARLQYLHETSWTPLIDFVSLDILYTYLHRFRLIDSYDRGEGTVRLDGLVDFPRHQAHMTASAGNDDFKTVWTVRRRGRAQSILSGPPETNIPPRTYVDASVQFRPSERTLLYLGVENLFNTDPPIVAYAPGNTFYEYYDTIGRRFFAGLSATF
ncbi:MAG: TonB-dependent receptor [Pseudomonadota bacterium]